jgi:hypothetical protein
MRGRDFLRIFLFVVVFLVINQGLSGLFVSWSRLDKEYGISHREFEEVQEQVSIVILGDSHPQKGVIASQIEGGYNFSTSAESYIFTYYKLKYTLERGDFHPEVAIVPVDLHSFVSFRRERVETIDPAFWDKYVNYLEYGRDVGDVFSVAPTILKAKLGVLGGFDQAVPIIVNEIQVPEMISGFLPTMENYAASDEKERIDRAIERAAFHFEGYTYKDEVLVEYFLRLLDLLDLYDITVVLVYYPFTELYYDAASEYIPVQSHLSMVESLVAEQPPALILDYHDLFFGQLDYFSDSDHLNVAGAAIFTDLLIKDLTEAGLLPVSTGQ